MRRFLLFCMTLILSHALLAQPQRGIQGNYCTDDFPVISFVWNTPNPEPLDKSMFTLTDEVGANVNFQFEALPQQNTHYSKSILFLWEDMFSHSNQTENTRRLLARFFNNGSIDRSDQFNVAVFNRKSSGDKHVLKCLSPDFTSNTDRLISLVEGYQKSTWVFGADQHPKETDLYLAINEGIDLLKAQPSDRVGVIVVVTAGLNMKAAGASTEMETVRKNAVEAGIPVYVVKYHELAGDAPEVNTLAESTYGRTMLLSDGRTSDAFLELQQYYEQLDEQISGRNYRITFTTDAKRDGKPHNIRMSVNKVEQSIPAFTAPDMTFGVWVKEHPILFVFLLIVALCVIGLVILFICLAIAKRNKKIAKSEAALKEKINQQGQAMNDMQMRHDQEKQQQIAEAAQKEQQAEEARLLNLMQLKNLFPQLKCQVQGVTFTYSMDKPQITIGRDGQNDLVLSDQTVSGYHADIRFTGTAFELVNKSKSYKQGVIVNGQFFQQYTLRSGDMIGLGEALLTFYV